MTMDRAPSVDPQAFRDALARLAGGVVIVTALDADGEPAGATVTAVCSVSLSPPLVLVCLSSASSTRRAIADTGRYTLHVLSGDDTERSDRFAGAGEKKFELERWEPGHLGCPTLAGALAVCECEVERAVEAGDHTVFIGRVAVAAVGEDPDATPLVWHRGRYANLTRVEGE